VTDTLNTAYTVNDIRELLRYRQARAAFDAQFRSMVAANPATDLSRGMNLNYWSALNCPQPGRLSEEVASTFAVYRRLLRESLAVLKKEFDEQTLLFFVGEVAERHGRTIDQMWPLTVQEFGALMDAVQSPGPVGRSAVPAAATESPGPQTCRPERKLTERQKLILAEMLALGAVGSTKKTTRKEVVRRVDRSKTPQDLARDFGVLKEANYTDSEPGPEGGVWLTGGGKRRAEKLQGENEQ
jgi:hypothetical protein